MIVYVGENKINLPSKQFGKGSEGLAYLYNNKIYKIYYKNAINEGYGNKEKYHKYLMSLKTDQVYLPINIIVDENGEYIGYVTEFASGNQKDKTGFTLFPSDIAIKNLITLENSFDNLSENYVLTEDVALHNCLVDLENNTVNIIDPGRYKNHCFMFKDDYKKANDARLQYLINLLLYIDFIKFKPVGSKRKEQLLKEYIINDKKQLGIDKYSEYFNIKLENYDNIHEYAKSLQKYIR